MRKLTKEQVEEIKSLREEGKKTLELAKLFKVSQTTIQYWVSEKTNTKVKKRATDWFKKKSLKEKKTIYEKRRSYLREYFKRRYNQDPIFRKKHIQRVINSKKKKEKSQHESK